MISWETCKNDFRPDGSLRDIYVSPASIKDWQMVFEYLRKQPNVEYLVDGISLPLPERVEQAFSARPSGSPMLRIKVGPMLIVFHFFHEQEIECDFVPNDITSQKDLDILLSFVRKIGFFTGREVVITPENCLDAPFITYSPKSDLFSHHAA
jgi:hypothetical protein